MADVSKIKAKHKSFIANEQIWKFLWESYEGGQTYIKGGNQGMQAEGTGVTTVVDTSSNLVKHPRESVGVYSRRQARAYYINYCGAIIDTYLSHLNREDPIIEVDHVAWDKFIKDVNRRGDSLKEFRMEIEVAAMVIGHTYILVDKPLIEAETLREEIEDGLPFFTHIYAWELIDWQLDSFGKPYWVKIIERDTARTDPLEGSKDPKPAYKIWTRQTWLLYNNEGEFLDGGDHNLGVVPIVVVKNRRSKANSFQGISAINDIAYINKRIFNLGSLIDEFAYGAAFPMLVNPAGDSEKSASLDVSGTVIFDFPDTAKHPPKWLSPPTDPLEFLSLEINGSIKEIQRLARLEAGFSEKKSANQSGVSKSFDWHSTATVLAEKADNFEEGEGNAIRLWLAWLDRPDTEFEIDYPDEFDIKAFEKDLEEALTIQTMKISKTYEAEVLKRVVKKHLPKLPEAELNTIILEIGEGVAKRFEDDDFESNLNNDIKNPPSDKEGESK